jgi:hypothetical protein
VLDRVAYARLLGGSGRWLVGLVVLTIDIWLFAMKRGELPRNLAV